MARKTSPAKPAASAKKNPHAEMSDAAVQAKTGKTWGEWFAALDKEKAQKLSHKEIATILSDKLGVGPWWSQMVTVAYERARGLRDKFQKTDGYSASSSKTIPVALAKLYDAWAEPKQRQHWLKEKGIEFSKTTLNKSMRLTWSDGTSRVEVNFYPKGEQKSQVAVQHNKLKSAEEVARLKEFWRERLAALADILTE